MIIKDEIAEALLRRSVQGYDGDATLRYRDAKVRVWLWPATSGRWGATVEAYTAVPGRWLRAPNQAAELQEIMALGLVS